MLFLNSKIFISQPLAYILLNARFSAVAIALFALSAHCRTVFSQVDKKVVHVMGRCCPACL